MMLGSSAVELAHAPFMYIFFSLFKKSKQKTKKRLLCILLPHFNVTGIPFSWN